MFGALFLSFVAASMCFAFKAGLGDIYVVVWIQRCHWELWMLALWPDLVNHAGLSSFSCLGEFFPSRLESPAGKAGTGAAHSRPCKLCSAQSRNGKCFVQPLLYKVVLERALCKLCSTK